MNTTIPSLVLMAALGASRLADRAPTITVAQTAVSLASKGADDGAGDDRGNHGPGPKAMLA